MFWSVFAVHIALANFYAALNYTPAPAARVTVSTPYRGVSR